MKPTIPLSSNQLAFLNELESRVPFIFDPTFTEILCETIATKGGARDIYRTENGVPVLYLRRHYLYRGPEREAMIHQFFLGDKGPLHDHPAASWGCILRVGYNERLCTHIDENGKTQGEYEVSREPGDWSYRPASNKEHDDFESFHKVKLRQKEDGGQIFTFFVMEKRNDHSWGFRDNSGSFTHYLKMNKQEATDKLQSEATNYGMGWFPKRLT